MVSPRAVHRGEGASTGSDTPFWRCHYYRTVCGLPAEVDPKSGLITFRAGPVWALEMPSQIAQTVKIDLDRRRLGGGPIISHPRNARWTFLIDSDIPTRLLERDHQLWGDRIRLLTQGEQISLPSPTDCGVFNRTWITATHTPHRPSGTTVIESLRRVLHTMRMVETTAVLPRLPTLADATPA
ncbi:hypothetical protein [Nocardia takedensis]|uniref:hypothetical protein n=1 Tax=Nocardia takedensis TaxID=259390 RepID=UPI0006883934|nr:hypothetical protein [Nocardia takedensis]